MNPADLADAAARALDLLPTGDPASSDPRLLREPQLAEEGRLSKDTAAAVWLAVSPLRVAPQDVLQTVMAEIHPPESPKVQRYRAHVFWLAASGWAAAIGIAVLLFPQSKVMREYSTSASAPTPPPQSVGSYFSPIPEAAPRDSSIRKEILKLQEQLARFREDPSVLSPRVVALTAPGAVRRTPEDARKRLHIILTNALRSALEAEGGASGDAASIVIERGWLPGGLPILQQGELIRHRNFPERDWESLGLFRSEDGSYYDSSSQTIWSPDPEGRGFVGRKINTEDQLTGFTQEPIESGAPKKLEASPEGFIVSNSIDGTTDIVVQNVPEVSDGEQLVMQTTNADGCKNEVLLTLDATAETSKPRAVSWNNVSPTSVNSSNSGAEIFHSTGRATGGSILVSLRNSTIPAGLQLIARDTNLNGQPDRVIVTTEP